MAGQVWVKVEGLKEVDQALGELVNLTKATTGKAVVRRVFARRLEPMRAAAEARAPVDKTNGPGAGKLKANIKIAQPSPRLRSPFPEGKVVVQVAMGPTSKGYPEAVVQEFGSFKEPAQAYMRPAWEEHRGDLLPGLAQDLGGEIEKVRKRAEARTRRLQKSKR